MKPKLLDLFAGAQGAAVGYARAGFEVHAVDIEPHDRHPEIASFTTADAFEVLADVGYCRGFDVITASPICRRHTKAQRLRANNHPDQITPTREALHAIGRPYVIENVPGAPLHNPIELCGCMFPGLRTYRERWFESPLLTLAPPHGPHRAPLAKMGRRPRPGEYMHVVGNFSGADEGRRAMGIDWMTRDDLREAIPPAYTQWVGEQLMEQLATSDPQGVPA